jgi:hypothetical protein
MSFMALWGGVFILYSGIFAARGAALRRDQAGQPPALGPCWRPSASTWPSTGS